MSFFKISKNSMILIVTALVGMITLASWSMPMTTGLMGKFFEVSDTVPKSSRSRIAALNEAIDRVEKATETLNRIDIAAEIAKAVESIHLDKVHSHVTDAVSQARSALEETDARHIKDAVAQALVKIDAEKIQASLQPQLQQSLDQAKRELERARQELKAAKQKIRSEKI